MRRPRRRTMGRSSRRRCFVATVVVAVAVGPASGAAVLATRAQLPVNVVLHSLAIPTVNAVSTETTCEVTPASVAPGRVRVALRNTAPESLELYVRDASGEFVAEVGHVDPGSEGNVTAILEPGDYTLECKAEGATPVGLAALRVVGEGRRIARPSNGIRSKAGVGITVRDTGVEGLALDGLLAPGGEVSFEVFNDESDVVRWSLRTPSGDSLIGGAQIAGHSRSSRVVLLSEPGRYHYEFEGAVEASGSFTTGPSQVDQP